MNSIRGMGLAASGGLSRMRLSALAVDSLPLAVLAAVLRVGRSVRVPTLPAPGPPAALERTSRSQRTVAMPERPLTLAVAVVKLADRFEGDGVRTLHVGSDPPAPLVHQSRSVGAHLTEGQLDAVTFELAVAAQEAGSRISDLILAGLHRMEFARVLVAGRRDVVARRSPCRESQQPRERASSIHESEDTGCAELRRASARRVDGSQTVCHGR